MTHRLHRGLALVVALLALQTGCGDDCTTDADCTAGQICTGRTCQAGSRDAGTTGDAGIPDAGPPPDAGPMDAGVPDAGHTEGEPVDLRTNDSPATAVPLPFDEAFEGVIGLPIGGADDVDVFQFSAVAGDLVEVRIATRGGGDVEPAARVTNADASYLRLVSTDGSGTLARRQVFIPVSGDYFVVVSDRRNLGTAPQHVGGPSSTYELRLTRPTPAPTPLTLPARDLETAIPADGSLPVFSFLASSGVGYRAETFAARSGADVDTVLFVVDHTSDTSRVAAANDDLGPGTTDSRAETVAAADGLHWVVVDYQSAEAARDLTLTVDSFDPSAEREPNDTRFTANALAGLSTPSSGAIDRASDAGKQLGDLDFFSFEAQAGASYEILVSRATGASASFAPAVELHDRDGAVTFANPNHPRLATARLEVYAFVAGPHFVRISAAGRPEEAPSGGPDFAYRVEVRPFTRTVADLTGFPVVDANSAGGAVDAGGKSTWFRFSIPQGPSKLARIDLDLAPASGMDGFALDSALALYGPDGSTRIASGHLALLRELPLDPGTYTLAVSDFGGSSSAGHHSFRPRVVSAADLPTVDDDGTHVDAASALPLTALPTWVTGSLTAGGQRWVALGTLPEGSRLSLLSAPTAGANADTRIAVVRADAVTVLAENDDVGATIFSRIDGVLLPATEAYFAVVSGSVSSSAGTYRLLVRTGGCPPTASGPAPGEIGLNEVFASPASPGGDANLDGAVDAGDQFVELVNFARVPRSASRLALRDASGLRFEANCSAGDIGPATALVVFGACPTGSCTGAAANADPVDPAATGAAAGLGLDEAGDLVMLLGPGGEVLDRLVIPAATPNVSFARGAAGSCDALPASPADLQPHDACTGARGSMSPGTGADGGGFKFPPGDTCLSPQVLSGPVTLTSQSSEGFASDFGIVECLYGGVSSDRVFSIVVPAGATLNATMTPLDPYAPALFLVAGPADNCALDPVPCLAGSPTYWAEPVTVSYLNDTGADATVFIVAAWSWTTGLFSLQVDLTP